ncbi:hypothetical protein INR49_020504 [Caranx melampygus]|nr:hypothetical protein INR49_020504 [Caranx melampygus]
MCFLCRLFSSVTNPCDRKKCEWLCLLSPSGPVCTCPNGRTLDNGTCVELPPHTVTYLGPCLVQCLNGGSCFLNAHKQPKCRCQPNYGGDRCEIDQCRDYCMNGGTCTPSPTGSCEGHCQNKGTCLQSEDGSQLCRCLPQFTGSTCEIDKCHYCRDGECIPSNSFSSTGEFTCRCTNGLVQPSCYTCDTNEYCANGQCSINPITRLPECRCSAGWVGHRCELSQGLPAPADDQRSHECRDRKTRLQDLRGRARRRRRGPTNSQNPVYATLYMGGHNSRNSLASTDEKKELLSRGDEEPLVDPLA